MSDNRSSSSISSVLASHASLGLLGLILAFMYPDSSYAPGPTFVCFVCHTAYATAGPTCSNAALTDLFAASTPMSNSAYPTSSNLPMLRAIPTALRMGL